jgi:hypothetical protein
MYPLLLHAHQVALSIKLIVTMELFLIGPFKTCISLAFRTDRISVPQGERDAGFERKKVFYAS